MTRAEALLLEAVTEWHAEHGDPDDAKPEWVLAAEEELEHVMGREKPGLPAALRLREEIEDGVWRLKKARAS